MFLWLAPHAPHSRAPSMSVRIRPCSLVGFACAPPRPDKRLVWISVHQRFLSPASPFFVAFVPLFHNERATRWHSQAKLAVCPITELGFLRISAQPSFGATVADAKKMLRDWKAAQKPTFVPCDLEVLEMEEPTTGMKSTDFYLASLAEKHGMMLATLDQSIGHKSVFVIPS